jgi:hypothetical protein
VADDAAIVVARPPDTADPSTDMLPGEFLRFPIGWEEDETLEAAFADVATGLRTAIGWLLTTLALTLGAGAGRHRNRVRAEGPMTQVPAGCGRSMH